MPPVSRFHERCRQVQFVLDKPVDESAGRRTHVADLVGRVRSHGLRVTETVTPELYGAARRVAEKLWLDSCPEIYVVNDPHANAFAPILAGGSTPFVIINSGLAELLSPVEMEFAIGHELGHLGLLHGIDEDEDRSEFASLQRRSRMRYAEISADRIGLLASRSVVTAARVMVKIASGLRDDLVVDVNAFLSQLERDPEEISREWELHESHPALPLRLLALMKFSRTGEYAQLSGSGQSGIALVEVDQEIADGMANVGDGRLDRMEQEFIHLALTWVGLSLIMEDSVIETHEQDALEDLVGKEHADKAMVFAQTHGHEAVQEKLLEAAHRIHGSHVNMLQRFRRSIEAFVLELDIKDWQDTATGTALAEIMVDGTERGYP